VREERQQRAAQQREEAIKGWDPAKDPSVEVGAACCSQAAAPVVGPPLLLLLQPLPQTITQPVVTM
jgi:hypothetical protein